MLDVLLAVRKLYASPIPDYVDQLARGVLNVPDRKFLSIHVRRAEIAQTGVELLLRHLQHAKTGIRIVQRTQHFGRAEAVCALVERFDIEPLIFQPNEQTL